MIALVADTETTNLTTNRILRLDEQLEIIEFYGCLVNLANGEIGQELDTLIKPSRPLSAKPTKGNKKTTTQITGITNEMLEDALSFSEVAPAIKRMIEAAPCIITHNAAFDREAIDIEFQRLGQTVNWPLTICTVEQTLHLKGYRLSLSDLHELLLNERFPDAHRARTDTQALIRCCVELHRRHVL